MFSGRKASNSEETPQNAQQGVINSSFWGTVSVSEFQQARQIPIQIPEMLAENALIYALQAVELELREFKTDLQGQGVESVEQLTYNEIGGVNFYQSLFKKAVFALAKNELLPEFATLAARELHEKRDFVLDQKMLIAESQQAIRLIKGKKRSGVYFI